MVKQYKKYHGLILLGSALIALVLLSASLSNLELQSGTPFPVGAAADTPNPSAAGLPDIQTYSLPLLRGIFALSFLMTIVYISARLIFFVRIKKLLIPLLALAALIIVAYLLPDIKPSQPLVFTNDPAGITEPAVDTAVSPLGQPPQWLVWAVAAAAVSGIATLVFGVHQGRFDQSANTDPLLKEAEAALNDLRSGMDLKDVILRCYFQMAQVLQEEQGVQRRKHMTVKEFEQLLEKRGFPPGPVRQLTRLFEEVRYGHRETSTNDENTALESLNRIIQFCRGERC